MVTIDGINLNYHKDKIFPLLVYNRAGKTIIICILTEMYGAIKGKLL